MEQRHRDAAKTSGAAGPSRASRRRSTRHSCSWRSPRRCRRDRLHGRTTPPRPPPRWRARSRSALRLSLAPVLPSGAQGRCSPAHMGRRSKAPPTQPRRTALPPCPGPAHRDCGCLFCSWRAIRSKNDGLHLETSFRRDHGAPREGRHRGVDGSRVRPSHTLRSATETPLPAALSWARRSVSQPRGEWRTHRLARGLAVAGGPSATSSASTSAGPRRLCDRRAQREPSSSTATTPCPAPMCTRLSPRPLDSSASDSDRARTRLPAGRLP